MIFVQRWHLLLLRFVFWFVFLAFWMWSYFTILRISFELTYFTLLDLSVNNYLFLLSFTSHIIITAVAVVVIYSTLDNTSRNILTVCMDESSDIFFIMYRLAFLCVLHSNFNFLSSRHCYLLNIWLLFKSPCFIYAFIFFRYHSFALLSAV